MDKRTREIINKGKEKYKASRERMRQDVSEADKNPPHGKKRYDHIEFVRIGYRINEIFRERIPIQADKESELSYAYDYYFSPNFAECKNIAEFAKERIDIDFMS